jgi:hypothetical protein
MKRLLLLVCLTIGFSLRPAFVAADSLTYNGLGSGTWVTLQIGSLTETGWAGEIGWLLKTPANTAGTAILTYCADLFDDAKIPTQNVTTTTTAALDASISGGSSLSLGALPGAGAKAAYLLNTYGAGAHGSNAAAAGLQLAIWQAMFGVGSFSYSTGLVGVTSAASGYYSGLMAALATNPSSVTSSTVTYFDVANDASHSFANAFGQDQIVGSPEPATIFLMIFAMAAAVGYHYRRRRVVA